VSTSFSILFVYFTFNPTFVSSTVGTADLVVDGHANSHRINGPFPLVERR